MRPLPLLRQAVLLVLVGQAVAAPTGNFTVGAERSAHKEFDLYRRYTSVNASENAADDPPIPRPTNKPQPKPEKPYVGYDSFHEIPERAPGKLAGVTWADMLVGFLRASPMQAALYNKRGLYYDGNEKTPQLGQGIHLAFGRDTWRPDDPSYWYCPVWADRAEFQSLAKAWIPPNAGNVECWSKGERPIADYIKAWFKDADPSRVIRMATIQNVRNPNIVHLTVPEALVDAKELNWKIECRASPRNIPNFFVRYGQFANVKGTQRGSGDNWRYPDHFWWPSQNTELLWGPLWDWTKPGRGKGKGRNEPDLEFEHQDS